MSQDALGHSIEYRLSWDDDWSDAPFLYADRVTYSVAPAISSAQLFYRAGDKILRPTISQFLGYERLALQGYYVKISIFQKDGNDPLLWYGTVIDRDETLLGFQSGASQRDSRQTFTAYGLEFLLDRKYLTTSIVERDNGSTDTIGRAIGFNLGAGSERDRVRRPNGSTAKGPDGAYAFARSLHVNDCDFWDADDIIKYLSVYHMPADINGDQILPWNYDDTAGYLPFAGPTLQVHGKTIREILNMIMDRRRAMSWAISVSEADPDDPTSKDSIDIIPFSFSETDIDFPSGDGFIPANQNPKPFDFDTELLARDPRLVSSRSTVHPSVIVRGERRGVVFTTAFSDATHDWVNFDINWTSDLQTEYNAGATGDSHYGDDDNWLRQQTMNQQARLRAKLESVYRWFKIPDDWDGTTNKSSPTLLVDDFAVAKGNQPIWLPGLRFEHHLPMRDGIDYSGTNIFDGNVTSVLPDDEQGDFIRPMGWINVGIASSTYERIDRLGLGLKEKLILPETLGRAYSITLKMHKDDLGFSVDVHGHAQCAIAKDDFTPADDADGPDSNDEESKPDLNYKDLLVTVYMLGDSYAEGQWPDPDNGPDSSDVHEPLLIQVHHYFCDYVLADTVLDSDTNGQLVKVTKSAYVRDDRDALKDMARMAYQWYSVERKALDVTLHTLDNSDYDIDIGDLITTIGRDEFETCNSVVTEIIFDTRAQTRTIKTQFAEMDVAHMAHGTSL
jgi:hypothetical protein